MIIKRDFLEINLSSIEVRVKKIEQRLLDEYIAGPPLALRLFFDSITEDDDIHHENESIIFTTGLLSSLNLPGMNTLSSVFLTAKGNIDEAQVSGGFSECFRALPWNGFLITGKADNPSVIVFDKNSVRIIDIPQEINKNSLPHFFSELCGQAYEALCIPENTHRENVTSVLKGMNNYSQYLTDTAGLAGALAGKNIKALIIFKNEFNFKKCDISLGDSFKTQQIVKELVRRFSESYNLDSEPVFEEFNFIYEDSTIDGESPCSTCPMKCYSPKSHQYFERMPLPLTNDWLALLSLEKSPIKALKIWKSLLDIGISPSQFSSIYEFLKKTISESLECFDLNQLSVNSLIESLSTRKGEFRFLTEGIYNSGKKYNSFGRNAAKLIKNFELPAGYDIKSSSFLTLYSLVNVSRPRFPEILWLLFTKLYTQPFDIEESTLLYSVKSCISFIKYKSVLEILGFCNNLKTGITEKNLRTILSNIGLDFDYSKLVSAAKRGYYLKRILNHKAKKFSFESSSWSFFIKPCYFNDKNIFHDFQRLIFTFYTENGLDDFGFPKTDILKNLNMENMIWI